jgi:hypothetical protein
MLAGLVLGLGTVQAVDAQGVAPAPPSYQAVERSIEAIQKSWAQSPPEAAPGWNTFFDAIRKELVSYSKATTSNDRLGPLNQVWQHSNSLEGMVWEPGNELRETLRTWLRPRVRLAWAQRRLIEAIEGTTASPEDAANRKNWTTFVDGKLGNAVREYEAAKSVQARQESLKKLRLSLASLRQTNPWTYSAELQAAADDLFNVPNFDITADVNSLFPVLANQVVITGPVYRNGYVSQVTAGDYAGFSLSYSDEGIAFNNSQYLTSVTPIHDFNQQMANDPQGQRATKMYQFFATSTDNGLMTVNALVTPNGLRLGSTPAHHFDAQINSAKAQGGGLQRLFASALGLGQQKITSKVYEGAIVRIRQNANQEAAAEAAERMGVAEAEQNTKLREFLPGDGSFKFKDLTVSGLSLRSRPENALIGGTLKWASKVDQSGADLPPPPKLTAPEAGISALVHVGSVANNLVEGFLSTPKALEVNNIMVVAGSSSSAKDAIQIKQNVTAAEYLKTVDEQAKTSSGTQVVRFKKPTKAPEFAVDAKGRLVLIVHDFQVDLPVPAQVAKIGFGTPPKAYRLVAPTAEFVFDIKAVTTSTNGIQIAGVLKEFAQSPGSKVLAIVDDESKALPLDPIRGGIIYTGFGTALKSKPINVPIENVKLKGYNIASISDLDPSGWLRVVLTPTGERPLAPVAVPPGE